MAYGRRRYGFRRTFGRRVGGFRRRTYTKRRAGLYAKNYKPGRVFTRKVSGVFGVSGTVSRMLRQAAAIRNAVKSLKVK